MLNEAVATSSDDKDRTSFPKLTTDEERNKFIESVLLRGDNTR